MRILLYVIFFIFTISLAINQDIGFVYGMLKKPNEKSTDLTILSDSTSIYTGEHLRINLGYLNTSNLYIVYKDATGEYMSLFDSNAVSKSEQDTIFVTALHWSELTNPVGYETFYFINSYDVQAELVKLLGRYDIAPAKGKKKLAKRIQDKINSYNPDFQDNLSSLSSQLDKPVTGGVAFRGEDNGVTNLSVTHECKGNDGIAFKRITLVHK